MRRSALLVLALSLIAAPGAAQGPPPPPMPSPPQSSTPGDVAFFDGMLYAVGPKRKVRRGRPGQSQPTVIAQIPGEDSMVMNAIAAARPGIAFTLEEQYRGRVMAAAHDGSKLRTLWTGSGSPFDVAFHGNDVVWTDYEQGRVLKTPFAGGKITELAQLDHPAQLTVAGDDAFVAVWSAGTIVRIPLRGGPPVVIASVPDGGPHGIAVQGDQVFFGLHLLYQVRAVARTGGPVTTVASYPGCAIEDIAVTATRIHFVCFGGGVISEDRRPGSKPVVVTRGVGTIHALVLTPEALIGYATYEDRFYRFPR
jgi:hypothetical protein